MSSPKPSGMAFDNAVKGLLSGREGLWHNMTVGFLLYVQNDKLDVLRYEVSILWLVQEIKGNWVL